MTDYFITNHIQPGSKRPQEAADCWAFLVDKAIKEVKRSGIKEAKAWRNTLMEIGYPDMNIGEMKIFVQNPKPTPLSLKDNNKDNSLDYLDFVA